MQTPKRISADEFVREYHRWRQLETKVKGVVCCAHCDQRIAWRFCRLSLHVMDFQECTGPGTVLTIDIPFCPSCEHEPEGLGCLHIPGLI